MRHSLPIFILYFLLLGACDGFEDLERTYDITPDEHYRPLIMNAQIDAGKQEHTVWFHTGSAGWATPSAVSDLTVRINGAVISEGPSEAGSKSFAATFHPGDVVRFDATEGDETVSAEVIVPEPVAIIAAEAVATTDWNRLDCRLTLQDPPGEQNRYRLGADYEVRYRKNYTDGRVEECVQCGAMELDTSDEPLISTGYTTDENDFNSLLVPENTWSTFTDSAFDGQQATLRFSASSSLFGVDWEWVLSSEPMMPGEEYTVSNVRTGVLLKLYSLSDDQYQYLKSITQLEAYDYDFNFLIEPVPLPTNVAGGLGFVAIDMPAVARIEL